MVEIRIVSKTVYEAHTHTYTKPKASSSLGPEETSMPNSGG